MTRILWMTFCGLIILSTQSLSMPVDRPTPTPVGQDDEDDDDATVSEAEDDYLSALAAELEALISADDAPQDKVPQSDDTRDDYSRWYDSSINEDLPQGDMPIEDLPQGDMPMGTPISDNDAQQIVTSASPTPPVPGVGVAMDDVIAERLRKRQLQKEMIFAKVWNYTRAGNRNHNHNLNVSFPNNTLPSQILQIQKMANDLIKNHSTTRSVNNHIKKRQSHYPSCGVPMKTSEDMWMNNGNGYSMNLLFNFSSTILLEDNKQELLDAKLRLYKISQVHQSKPLVPSCSPPVENCTSCDGSNATGENNTALGTRPGVQGVTEDTLRPSRPIGRQVRVSVYWYTRPLKKNRVKHRPKLLDSQMVSLDKDEWTTLNVYTAVRTWLDDTRKNFGLLVEVEDEDRCLLPASRIFKVMNCTEETATARPLPFPLINAYNSEQDTTRDAYTFNNFFPLMDITTSAPVDSFMETVNAHTSSHFRSPPSQHPPGGPPLSSADAENRPEDQKAWGQHQLHAATTTVTDPHRHRHGDNTGATQGSHRRRRKQENADQLTQPSFIPSLRSIIALAAERQSQLLSTSTKSTIAR